jgi:hypothetical protein
MKYVKVKSEICKYVKVKSEICKYVKVKYVKVKNS